MKPADLATHYQHYYTPKLIARLKAVKTVDAVTPKLALPVLGLGTTVSGPGGVQATKACKEATSDTCQVFVIEGLGDKQSASPGGTGLDSTTLSLEGGQVKFRNNVFLPVATDKGVDSYMDANLMIDLVLVPNPLASKPSQLPYLIDQINNTQTMNGIHRLSKTVIIS